MALFILIPCLAVFGQLTPMLDFPSFAEGRGTEEEARLWTVGASVGTSFSAPWLIFTLHGTIPTHRNFFLEMGCDLGLVGGKSDADYHSDEDISKNIFAIDLIAGVNLMDMLDISYTLRTSFTAASHKISAGYTWRFR